MSTEVRIVCGTGAVMVELPDECAQLIVTSPPYFPGDVEDALRAGVTAKDDLEGLQVAIETFAWSLRPVFDECFRVLKPGGRTVVQTRDVRLSHLLVPVESLHRQMLEATGMQLYARHLWRPYHLTMPRRRRSVAAARALGPTPFDLEEFLVFWKRGILSTAEPADKDLELLQQDIVCTSSGKLPHPHRFQSPLPMLRALVRTYSRAGDLVVDPFAGGGSTLVTARALGRSAWGCDIDSHAVEMTQLNLSTRSASR